MSAIFGVLNVRNGEDCLLFRLRAKPTIPVGGLQLMFSPPGFIVVVAITAHAAGSSSYNMSVPIPYVRTSNVAGNNSNSTQRTVYTTFKVK